MNRPISLPISLVFTFIGLLGGVVADRVYIATILSRMATTLEANQSIMVRLEGQEKDVGAMVQFMRSHQIRNEGLIDLHTQEINVLRARMGLPALVIPQALTTADKE